MLDNTIRSRPGRTQGPVIHADDNFFAVGNTFTVPAALECNGRAIAFDNQTVAREQVPTELPALPGVAARLSRPVIEVSRGATADAIQKGFLATFRGWDMRGG